MNTPTPRTDAESFLSRGMGIVPTLPKEAVRIDFARTLERELTAVTEQRDGLHELHNKNAARSQELLELCRTLRKELTAMTEQRDRLAKALQKLADCDWVITLPDRMDAVRKIANEALQSLTPNVKP